MSVTSGQGTGFSPLRDTAALGIGISLAVSLLWVREHARDRGHAAWGGSMVGGVCALVGIAVSFGLGDVTAVILAFGTVTSAICGAPGGLAGSALRKRRVAGA